MPWTCPQDSHMSFIFSGQAIFEDTGCQGAVWFRVLPMSPFLNPELRVLVAGVWLDTHLSELDWCLTSTRPDLRSPMWKWYVHDLQKIVARRCRRCTALPALSPNLPPTYLPATSTPDPSWPCPPGIYFLRLPQGHHPDACFHGTLPYVWYQLCIP